MKDITIEKLITVDNNGMPKAPTVRQLQDKDILTLYTRDTTQDKRMYLKECGVIYYMGDPKSPVRMRGLSDKECLKEAIENYDLPSNYVIDSLVRRIIDKYYISNITEAGVALEALNRSIHLVSISAVKINDILSKKLAGEVNDENISSILTLMDSVSKRVSEIPNLTKSLKTAYDNLKTEEEELIGRGGQVITSSMNAEDN